MVYCRGFAFPRRHSHLATSLLIAGSLIPRLLVRPPRWLGVPVVQRSANLLVVAVVALLVPEHAQPLGNAPGEEADNGDDGIGDAEATALLGHVQTNTAVDESENKQHTTIPDVRIAHRAAAASRQEVPVVNEAKERLDGEQADHNGAENGMTIVEELCVKR